MNNSKNIEREAHEVGCNGLIEGYASRLNSGQRIHAATAEVTDGPFKCEACQSDAVLRKCVERIDHFAHKARLSPVVSREESELHKTCKEQICQELHRLFPDGKWECERYIPAKAGIPALIPDISGKISGQRIVIEVQASTLTIKKIIHRAANYRKLGCAILWLVPLTEALGEAPFRPRLYERYLHTMYYGRTYYWQLGDGASVRPVHYGVAYRYIERSEWTDSDGAMQSAGGYFKSFKIVKQPMAKELAPIAESFSVCDRGEFYPWNELKAIPRLLTWQDNADPWWDTREQSKFEQQNGALSR